MPVQTVSIDRSLRRSLAAFDADRLRWLDEAAALGPIAKLRFGAATVWVVSDADAARAILVSDSGSWTRPPAMRVPIRLGVGENLFSQSDKAWAALQPRIAPMFRKRALEARLGALGEILESEVAALPLAAELDLELALGRIALVAAAWMLFGERLERDRASELAAHQRYIVQWVGQRLGKARAAMPYAAGPSARAMRAHRRVLERYADEVIARGRERSADATDALGALALAQPGGRPLNARALRGHLLGLLFAGNETTAAALCWALVHAARWPSEWARLREEPGRARAYVDETLRISPPAWGLTRTPTRGGVTLRALDEETRVRRPEVVTVYLRGAHRDPMRWPDPLRFDPDRHIAADHAQQRGLLAFGLGPRGCIGQHLAIAEMVAVLPVLARHCDVRTDVDVVEDAGFALRVAGGLRGRLIEPGPEPA
jgi:cytochrome P450